MTDDVPNSPTDPAAVAIAAPAMQSSPRRIAAVFAAVVLIAFALRLIHMYEALRLPYFYSPISDGRSYDEWSRRIVAGDWLGREVFYQAPFYPYFLAVTQLVTGHDLWRIRLAQIALGSLACGLLFLAGRRFFGTAAGAMAGFFAAVYAPAIYFDALIQKAALDMFFMCLLIWLLARLRQRLSAGAAMMSGIVLACFALTRENVLLFYPVIAVWLLWGAGLDRGTGLVCRTGLPTGRESIPSGSRRLKSLATFTLGVGLVLVPVGLRNQRIGGAFLITTSQFGPNLFIGNNENATGLYAPLRAGRDDPVYERDDAVDVAQQSVGRILRPAEVSDYWRAKAIEWISSHPGAWLGLMAKKLLLLFNAYEVPDAEDIYFYELHCPLIRGLSHFTHFGTLAPLAVAGIVLTWPRRRAIWLLHALLITLAAGIALFYIMARYRVPMVPILLLFASAALTEGAAVVRSGESHRLVAAVFVAALAAVPINWPMIDRSSHAALGHLTAGSAFFESGNYDAAIDEYKKSLAINPNHSTTHFDMAGAYWRMGRLPDAIASYRRAMALRPDDLEIVLKLGTVLSANGELVEAEGYLRAALPNAQRRPEVFNNLGVLLVKLKKWDEAIDILRRGARATPDQPGVLANLAWNLATCPLAELRDGPAAVQAAETCCKLTGLKDPRGFDILAAAYAEVGRFGEAVGSEQRALQLAARIAGFKDTPDFEARLRLYQSNRPYRRGE